ALISGGGVVERGPGVRPAFDAGALKVALVQPGDVDIAEFVHEERGEAVGGDEAVVVDGAGCFERLPAVQRAREADIAGVALPALAGPREVDLASGSEGELGAVFAVHVDGFGIGDDGNGLAEILARGAGARDMYAVVLHESGPEIAGGIEGDGGAGAAVYGDPLFAAVGGSSGESGKEQQESGG